MSPHPVPDQLARSIVTAVDVGLRLVSSAPAFGSFTNTSLVLTCETPAGATVEFVAKFLDDEPDSASRCARASYRALRLARAHGIPVPEPVYVDETGAVMGVPGIVTQLVEGRQQANPPDPVSWGEMLAELLVRVHDITPSAEDQQQLFDGDVDGLFLLYGDQPARKGGHPLSEPIFNAMVDRAPTVLPGRRQLVHSDYWPGNVLWQGAEITALIDWDFAACGDPALDVGYFRMNMFLRGVKPAADVFLDHYEGLTGAPVPNLGFWELVAAGRPLPEPVLWIPASREMGDAGARDDRARTDYFEFVDGALRRTHQGR